MNKKLVLFSLLSIAALSKAEHLVSQPEVPSETSNVEPKYVILAEINDPDAWKKLSVIRFINLIRVATSNKWLAFAEITRDQGLYILKQPFVIHAKTRKIQ